MSNQEQCPLFMADGRTFTSYMPKRDYHQNVIKAVAAINTHDVRDKLINLGKDPIAETPNVCQRPLDSSAFFSVEMTNLYVGAAGQDERVGRGKHIFAAVDL